MGRWSPLLSSTEKRRELLGKWTASAIKLSDNTKRPNSLWLTFRSREASSEASSILEVWGEGVRTTDPVRQRFVSSSRSLSYHLKLINRKLLLFFWDRKCRRIKQRQQARTTTSKSVDKSSLLPNVTVFEEGKTSRHRRAAADAAALWKHAAIIKTASM